MTTGTMDRKKYSLIILSLATAVTVIHIVFICLYGISEFGMSFRYVWYEISGGILECLIVYLMLYAWRVRKKNLKQAILLGTVSILAFFITDTFFREALDNVIEILMFTAPFICWSVIFKLKRKLEKRKAAICCGIIWSAAVLIVVFVTAILDEALSWLIGYWLPVTAAVIEGWFCIWVVSREYGDEETRRKWLWITWLGCNAFAILIASLDTNLSHFWVWSCWGSAIEAAMPILYALLFRFLMSRKWNEVIKLMLYYGICLFLYNEFFSGIINLVIPIFVCFMESRGKKQGAGFRVAISALYSLLWAVICFFGYRRLREIIYDLGGPAVNIQLTERVNWLGYKIAAIKSYFAGNTDAFLQVSGLAKEEYPGYLNFVTYNSFGSLPYRFGRWWLLIMTLLVVAVAVLLMRKNLTGHQTMHRMMQYMSVGYLIRVMVSCVYIVTMTRLRREDFPFNAYKLMDLLMLGLLLRWNAADDTQLASNEGSKAEE